MRIQKNLKEHNSHATPKVGVSALVQQQGKILVIRRGQSPNKGLLAFPGGKLHWGESLKQAVVRELKEETGVRATVDSLIDVVDVLMKDASNQVTRHFVVLCYLCHWLEGSVQASDDASAVYWMTAQELLQRDDVVQGVHQILQKLAATPSNL